MNPAVEARGLKKTFPGRVNALTGLDFAVAPGTVYGLVGRNGAGKTTALRAAMGVLRPSAGCTSIFGTDMWRATPAERARVAYVPQTQQLHSWMSLDTLSAYLGHFYPDWDAATARRIAARFELAWNRPVGVLSGGEQRKAHMTLALAARTPVLILDEPAAGLDPIARRQFIDEIVDLLAEDGERTSCRTSSASPTASESWTVDG